LVYLLLLLSLSVVVNRIMGVNVVSSGYGFPSEIGENRTVISNSFRSDISVPAVQNLTFSGSNLLTVEIPSQASPMSPTALTIDVARGFEPQQRFNSSFRAFTAPLRKSNIANSTLKEMESGLSLFFNATSYPCYTIFNVSFVSPLIVSKTDFVSFAFQTSNSFNSSQALIGISLMLRDQQGNRNYVSVVVSNQHSTDSFGLSEWFLGEGFTIELPKYPYYSMRYDSLSGPWFKQLSLSESLSVLNLSSAWLDGLLVGGEIGYIGPPLGPYTMTEVDAMFYFTLVHPQPFSINQQPVNSTVITFPYQNSLSFSGIPARRVTITIKGFLKPSSEKEELLDDETVSSCEVFFDLSGAAKAGVDVNGVVNITVFSKDVKKCLLTLDNDTDVDLTDTLLANNSKVYVFPKSTSTLKVFLVLFRFNAWIFAFSFLGVVNVTKSGIVEERFSAVGNEGVIDINTTVTGKINLAIRTDEFTPRAIALDGIEKPIESMLVINEETYFIVSLVGSGQTFSLYTIQYVLSDRPLFESLTVTPFEVHFNNSVFRIFTPFNIEGEQGFYIPITIQMVTYRTFILKVEYDFSFFEAEQKEIMAYSSRIHYEYFALKPLQIGQSTVGLKISDAANEKTVFSTLFSVHISSSFPSRILLYFTFCVTVLSIVVVFKGKNLAKWILHR